MKIQSLFRGALYAGALLLGVGSAQKADAATLLVNSPNDSGPGTLRQAILSANASLADDTIVFDELALIGPNGIYLNSGELRIANRGKLTINGPTSFPLKVGGQYDSRVFTIAPSANVTINRLSLVTGVSSGEGNLKNGAVIFNSGNLAINDSDFYSNSTAAFGNGGAIYSNRGNLTISNSRFSENAAYNRVGEENGDGGAIYNDVLGGLLTINDCTFASNYASSGGAIYNASKSSVTVKRSSFENNRATKSGGAIFSVGSLAINDSTFSGNEAQSGDGAGIYNVGAPVSGVPNSGTTRSVIQNSTFVNNRARSSGGGIYLGDGSGGSIDLSVESSTFFANSGAAGGGIFKGSGTLSLNNSIVASNSGGATSPNLFGTVSLGDHNLVDDPTGAVLVGDNIIGQDPRLAALADNGGPTKTCMLLVGSPAIDNGYSHVDTDQRGYRRAVYMRVTPTLPNSNRSDIGAVEVNDLQQSSSNLVVNQTDDHNDGVCSTGDCTLREAITAAVATSDESTITFDKTYLRFKRALTISKPLPPITNTVNIVGPTTLYSGITLKVDVSAGSALQVSGGTLALANLTITNEVYSNLSLYGGTVTLQSCTLAGGSYGIFNGTGSSLLGSVTAINSTIADHSGAAIYTGTGSNTGVSLESCTLTRNGQGLFVQGGTVNLSNSLIVGNSANIEYAPSYDGSPLDTSNHNLVTGTSAEAGLDPDGLKDNGGPTATVALFPGGRAVNVGATTLAIDQRGVLRDSQRDIGAFEANAAPQVVSLSPLDASDKVGAKRTFTVTVNDVNGLDDIKEINLLINGQLLAEGGALLRYIPDPNSPTSGTLSIRTRYGWFSEPLRVGTLVNPRAGLDNGAVTVLPANVKVTTSGTSLTITLPLTIRDGLVGTNRVFARVVDKAGATDSSAAPGDEGYRRFGNYTVSPQFSGATNNAPVLSNLHPGATYSTSFGSPSTFSFYVTDPDGTGDIESVWFMAGKQRGWANSATFVYQPRTRRLFLRSDDGQQWLGGGIIGLEQTISNSQVRVRLSQVRVLTYGDGKTLGIIIPMQPLNGLIGQNKVWLRVQDNQGATVANGDDQGYVMSGLWSVAPIVTPRSAPAPSASAGGS